MNSQTSGWRKSAAKMIIMADAPSGLMLSTLDPPAGPSRAGTGGAGGPGGRGNGGSRAVNAAHATRPGPLCSATS